MRLKAEAAIARKQRNRILVPMILASVAAGLILYWIWIIDLIRSGG